MTINQVAQTVKVVQSLMVAAVSVVVHLEFAENHNFIRKNNNMCTAAIVFVMRCNK